MRSDASLVGPNDIRCCEFLHWDYPAASVLLNVDRNGSGVVPLLSGFAVAGLLLLSMLLFSALMKGLSDLQINNVLRRIGDKGREVIHETFQRLDAKANRQSKGERETGDNPELGPVVQTLRYFAAPRTIARFDIDDLSSSGTTGRSRHRDGMRGRRHPRLEYGVAAGSWCENCTARKRPLTCLQTIT